MVGRADRALCRASRVGSRPRADHVKPSHVFSGNAAPGYFSGCPGGVCGHLEVRMNIAIRRVMACVATEYPGAVTGGGTCTFKYQGS